MMDSERIVGNMLSSADQIWQAAIEEYKPVAIVAAFSGGDDSIVSTHYAMNHGADFVFHAGTLVSLKPCICHLRDVCGKHNWTLKIEDAKAEGPPKKMRQGGRLVQFDPAILPAGKWTDGATAYEEFCLNHGFPGRGKPQHARMYQRLKERPIRRMLKELGASKAGRKVLIASGIRHDESAIRAGYKRATAEGYFGDVWVNPFYFDSRVGFEMYRQEFGLPRSRAKWYTGISGDCCCGTFGSANERESYREVDADFADYLFNLETRVKNNGFPWGWAESPPKWWLDERRGARFLFDIKPSEFQPMCVQCTNGRR